MTKPRRPRSDSITAAIEAAQRGAVRFTCPEYLSLRPPALPYWQAIIACRDDWREDELILAVHLARALCDAERLQSEIDAEGDVIEGKANPKFAIAETLSRRAISLTRHLQIHALATRGKARDVAKKAKVHIGDDDGLIAMPVNSKLRLLR